MAKVFPQNWYLTDDGFSAALLGTFFSGSRTKEVMRSRLAVFAALFIAVLGFEYLLPAESQGMPDGDFPIAFIPISWFWVRLFIALILAGGVTWLWRRLSPAR